MSESIRSTGTISRDTGGLDAQWETRPQPERLWPNLFPAPSHEALTDSITAMRETQRRLMVVGRLTPAG